MKNSHHSNRYIKKSFNESAAEWGGGDYEKRRWFSDEIQKANYQMTRQTIEHHLFKGLKPLKSCFELGPGPGTWTQLFLEKHPHVSFDLVDISGEMLKQAQRKLGVCSNIRHFESDFLDFQPDRKYDLFISIRALEYVISKEEAAKKIAGLLRSGGKGFIITKTPKYARQEVLRRKTPELHRHQISPSRLKELLENYGFKNIEMYPTTMIFPLLNSPKLNMLLFKIFYKHKLNLISQFFAESYCIRFDKP